MSTISKLLAAVGLLADYVNKHKDVLETQYADAKTLIESVTKLFDDSSSSTEAPASSSDQAAVSTMKAEGAAKQPGQK